MVYFFFNPHEPQELRIPRCATVLLPANTIIHAASMTAVSLTVNYQAHCILEVDDVHGTAKWLKNRYSVNADLPPHDELVLMHLRSMHYNSLNISKSTPKVKLI